MAGTVTL